MSQSAVRTEVRQTAESSAVRRLVKSIVGIIVSPIATLGDVARDPRPFAMILFVSTITATGATIFLSTDVGKLAWLDEAMRQADAFGLTISDVQYAQLERLKENAMYLGLVENLVGIPLIIMALAGIIKAVFAVTAGADVAFRQLLGVVAASAVILTLRQLFVLPLNYVRESMTSFTNLGALWPMLPDGSFLARFLGTIDLFAVWWLLVLTSGLGSLYRRRVHPIAATFFVYGLIALGMALVLMLTGGG